MNNTLFKLMLQNVSMQAQILELQGLKWSEAKQALMMLISSYLKDLSGTDLVDMTDNFRQTLERHERNWKN